jgi:feruloyl esterase
MIPPGTGWILPHLTSITMRLLSNTFLLAWQLSGLADSHSIPNHTFHRQCESFQPEKLIFNSTRTRLEHLPGSTILQLDDNVGSCNRPSQNVTVEACRIALQIPTSSRSSISFELWLPSQWSGKRFLATGNGGVDGCEFFLSRAISLMTFRTNNNHRHQI